MGMLDALAKKGLGSMLTGKAKKTDKKGANVRGTKIKTKREKAMDKGKGKSYW